MLSIEIEVNNELNTQLKEDELPQEITSNIWSNIGSSIDSNEEVMKNYYNNYFYVASSFCNEMFKMEKELFENWNLKDGLYKIYEGWGDYENNSILPIIKDNLADKFYVAKNMSDINNEQVIKNCKQEIIKQYNKEIDQYAKLYKLDKKLVDNIKGNLPELVDKYLNKVANKILNNSTRDRLENYCERLEQAYDKGDFNKMKQVTNQILQYLSKETTVYRDEDLFKRLRTDITKSQMVQNKIKEGKMEKLSNIEEELLNNFDIEQMNILQSKLERSKQLDMSNISMASLEMETNILKKIAGE